jgi:IclR family pca regulon transcriptional regulator
MKTVEERLGSLEPRGEGDPPQAPSRNLRFVESFARGLRLIEVFGHDAPRLSLSEVAKRAGLDRAVARRLLLTLVELGFVRLEGKSFELTSRVLRLGFSFLSAQGLDRRLQPYLDELAQTVKEPVSVAVIDGPEVVFVARSDAAGRHLAPRQAAGFRLPAYVSVAGRVLLAAMPDADVRAILAASEIRAFTDKTLTDRAALLKTVQKARLDGYTVIDQELEEGMLAAAVPVRDRQGHTVAALNVSSSTARMTRAKMTRTLVPILRETAAELSQVLL